MENDGNLDLSELLDPFLRSDLGSNTHRTIHLNFKNIPVFSTIAFGVASVLEQISSYRQFGCQYLCEGVRSSLNHGARPKITASEERFCFQIILKKADQKKKLFGQRYHCAELRRTC